MNISIGNQDFESIRTQQCFYIDKTGFIKEWWENKDSVTVINRPRRFGKTLNMSMLNASFKTNPYVERSIMTGITRVSKESIFSDLNNLTIVTTTSEKYGDCFGFTEEEVFMALENAGLGDQKQKVKEWYDGFTFGKHKDIYNPWSITNFLEEKKIKLYWANSSSNSLVSKLIRESSPDIKIAMEHLLEGKHLKTEIDEQTVLMKKLSGVFCLPLVI